MKVITHEQVAMWLRDHQCPMTSLELYYEWQDVHHELFPAPLVFADMDGCAAALTISAGTVNIGMMNKLVEQSVVNMLLLYKRRCGAAAVAEAVKKVMLQSEVPDVSAESNVTSGGGSATSNTRVVEVEDHGEAQLSRVAKAEEELSTVTSVLSEQLPTLVHAVDPLQKDCLIPLISLSATISSKKNDRVAARLLLLSLYLRPNAEHRSVVAGAWVRTLQHTPRTVMRHEVIPELYNLANARAAERRILALTCLESLVQLMGEQEEDIVFRQAICEGLLLPLSEDESKTVRYHVVRCLTALWPTCPSIDLVGGVQCNDEVTECHSRFLELHARLMLHDTSATVRRRALRSMRESIIPNLKPRVMLLTHFIPLFLSLVNREVLARTNHGKPMPSGSHATDIVTSHTTANVLDATDESADRTITLLATLIGDALTHSREDVEERDVPCARSAFAERSGGVPGKPVVSAAVINAYLDVVLPTTRSLLLDLHEHETLCSCACALASSLARMVSSFSTTDWRRAREMLLLIVAGRDGSDATGWEDAAGAGAGNSTVSRETHKRCLCFFITFLTCVAGLQDKDAGANSADVRDIVNDATALMRDTIVTGKTEEEEERKRVVFHADARNRHDVCGSAFTYLMACTDEPGKTTGASAVLSALNSLAQSPDVPERVLALALVERVSALMEDDGAQMKYLWPAVHPLMYDKVFEVTEAAVKTAVSMVAFITKPEDQEEVLQKVLDTVKAEGYLSRLSVVFLLHWCSLMRIIAAEPREQILYNYLATVAQQLAKTLSPTAVVPAERSGVTGRCTVASVAGSMEIQEVLQAVLTVLAAIPHCAVVTPQLVRSYLIPSIRLLLAVTSLSESCRVQLNNITKEYEALLLSSGKKLHSEGGFFERIRNEIKRRF
ncbi:hypothetical protein, conserved [Trypanosoma brucei gambiense DAL972]|uniref:Uncharacterized protein n=1 Tax=Trypanosoma brucei gambiense (strain MHOM/CI/86/DAL972) TaxID=679716 RepID=D0A8S2_TRYB9|nr:hypothetical protein, conserved [Trypanosoma brucei gambiense DAL972]CBH18073.1 hypothetical protein, conserved [Trypanosoma brucei gambiense DAL972]|eukprot:XP_011780337.1 hypothetical protein, conserved [Trypanosoma brucei gambiense DAL972]